MERAESQKRDAAYRAADWVVDGMRVGLGTGSTVQYLLERLAERRRGGELADLVCVPTSEATDRRARELGLPIVSLAECPSLDLTIDGADEVDPALRLIKGLGGALLREKIVATVSARLAIMVDESKLVERLGTRAPLPVEVEPFSAPIQPAFLRSLGAEPTLRSREGTPVLTDGGNLVFDCRFPDGIRDPEEIARRLDGRTGIIEHGLFLGMADRVVVAGSDGIRVLEAQNSTELP